MASAIERDGIRVKVILEIEMTGNKSWHTPSATGSPIAR